jgi:hypothetical protein
MKKLLLQGAIVVLLCCGEVSFGQVESVKHADPYLACPSVVDQSAEPVEGKQKMFRGLSEKIRFPKGCLDSTIFFELMVDSDGRVTDVRVVQGPECADVEKAIEYLQQTKWTPATHEGKNICQRMILPVQIHLG